MKPKVTNGCCRVRDTQVSRCLTIDKTLKVPTLNRRSQVLQPILTNDEPSFTISVYTEYKSYESAHLKPADIAENLRRLITSGAFSPGESLVQADLASRFNVSRIPVREALSMLANEGLVALTSGQGAKVANLNLAELIEIYDLRLLLEPRLAASMVAGSSPRLHAEITSVVNKMAAESDLHAWMRLNAQFHISLFDLSNQRQWVATVKNLFHQAQPYSLANVSDPASRAMANQEHLAMVAALEAGSSSELAKLIEDHLQHAKTRLTEMFESESGK